MILATIAAYALPEEFTASATLVFERDDTRFSQAEEILKAAEFSEAALKAELDVMGSREFLEQLIDSLELMNDPYFSSDTPGGEAKIGVSPESITRSQRESVVSALVSAISVKRQGNSLTAIVSATHPEPDQAARIANAVVDLYARDSLQLKRNELVAAVDAVKERTGQMEKKIAETERAIADYMNENQLDGVGSDNLRENRLRSEIAQVQSQLRVLQEQQAGEEKSSSPQLELLNDKLAELTGELHQLVVADMQYRTLTETLETYRAQRNRMVDQIVTLQGQADLQKPGARVISQATVPTEPSFPRRNMILVAGFIGSSILALLLLFLVEELFAKVNSDHRLMQITGVPNLARIPELDEKARKRPSAYLKGHPRSHYAAATQSLYFGACMAIRDEPRPKVIALTSALPGEGKSTLSMGMAITAARLGLKVVLLDLDLHFGGVSKIMELDAGSLRLEAYLKGELTLQDAVVEIDPAEVPGLYMIASAPASAAPSTLLHSARLSELISTLKRSYDLVIVDTPPLLVVDDISIIGELLDAVVLVARWGRTTERATADAVRRLRLTKAPLRGTVINRAKSGRGGGYGYAYNSYYRQAEI
jgi:capsular exopolysaccharide synthesis family protein